MRSVHVERWTQPYMTPTNLVNTLPILPQSQYVLVWTETMPIPQSQFPSISYVILLRLAIC